MYKYCLEARLLPFWKINLQSLFQIVNGLPENPGNEVLIAFIFSVSGGCKTTQGPMLDKLLPQPG